jgi:cobalamin biosynthesis protein CobD/CbiB
MKFNPIKFLWGKEATFINGLYYWAFCVAFFSPGILLVLLLTEGFNIPLKVAIPISVLYTIFHLTCLCKLIEKEQDGAVERVLFHMSIKENKQKKC